MDKAAEYLQAIEETARVLAGVRIHVPYPHRKPICLELNRLCRILKEAHVASIACGEAENA